MEKCLWRLQWKCCRTVMSWQRVVMKRPNSPTEPIHTHMLRMNLVATGNTLPSNKAELVLINYEKHIPHQKPAFSHFMFDVQQTLCSRRLLLFSTRALNSAKDFKRRVVLYRDKLESWIWEFRWKTTMFCWEIVDPGNQDQHKPPASATLAELVQPRWQWILRHHDSWKNPSKGSKLSPPAFKVTKHESDLAAVGSMKVPSWIGLKSYLSEQSQVSSSTTGTPWNGLALGCVNQLQVNILLISQIYKCNLWCPSS